MLDSNSVMMEWPACCPLTQHFKHGHRSQGTVNCQSQHPASMHSYLLLFYITMKPQLGCLRPSAGLASRPILPIRAALRGSLRLVATRAASPLDGLDLDIPMIDGDVRSLQQELGAEFNDAGVPTTFGNPRQAVSAIESGVVLVDRSHWGRLRISGDGRANFLHGQSTNDINRIKPGQGCDTVFVSSTARAIDLATVLVSPNSIMVLVSPTTKQAIVDQLNKFIFPADKVQVQDVSDKCAMFSLIGPESEKVLEEVAGDAISVLGKPYGTHQVVKFKTGPLIVVVGSGLASPGYTLIADESIAGDLYALLASKGCVLMGEDEWEIARVLEGRPAPGAELTKDYNPLEAGLAHAVSVQKGCYVGQETLAKVAAKDGVKQQLWGLVAPEPVTPGVEVQEVESGERLGKVTSGATTPEGKHVALAYLRTKGPAGRKQWEGAQVKVGSLTAEVVSPPFVTRTLSDELPELMTGPGADAKLKAEEDARREAAAAAAAEAAAKAERLRAMQERLAAWQAQQAAFQQQAQPKQ